MAKDDWGNWWCDEEFSREQAIARFMRRVSTVAEMRFFLGLLENVEVVGLTAVGYLMFDIDGARLIVCAQRVVEEVRVDFILGVRVRERHPKGCLFVEIDDPSHWRDPVKAASDRVRDRRHLRATHMPTMRFSNEEVTGNPSACAVEALEYCVTQFELEQEGMTAIHPPPEVTGATSSTAEAPN